MNKKYIIGLSVLLTLFILGGVIGITRAASNRQDTFDSIDPELQEQIIAREAAYNDLIVQANQQIDALNNQVNALQDGSTVISGQETISAQEAVDYAQGALDDTDYLLDIPELASYLDQPVFAVSFSSGTVYVDAFSGEVLYSSIPVKIDEQQALTIAADYLELTDLSGANVQTVVLEGSEFFKVTISSYVVYIDSFGNITKVQLIQYAPQTSSSGSSSSSHEREDDDHDDEHDDDEHDDDD